MLAKQTDLEQQIADAPDAPTAADNPAYLEKYGERIKNGWGSPEKFASEYSVPLRFTPRRVRGF